jgi:hypothetical protein
MSQQPQNDQPMEEIPILLVVDPLGGYLRNRAKLDMFSTGFVFEGGSNAFGKSTMIPEDIRKPVSLSDQHNKTEHE